MNNEYCVMFKRGAFDLGACVGGERGGAATIDLTRVPSAAAANFDFPFLPTDATVCPIAIKYNKIFVDAFWNSKRQSFSAHLVRGSWAGRPGWWAGGRCAERGWLSRRHSHTHTTSPGCASECM